MRVGFFISSLSGGGAEKVLITIAQSMADNNIGSVSITSLEKRPQFYQVDEEKVELYKIKNKHTGIRAFWEDFVSIRKHIKNDSAEVMISFLSRCNLLLLLCCLFNNRKIIVCDRNNPLKEHSRVIFWLSCLLYKRANRIVVQTNQIKTFYPRFLQKKIVVIENPIDNHKLQNELCRDGYNTKRVISMGRLEPQKDFETLIKAFAEINKQFSDWKLDIYGTGEKQEIIQKLIDDLNLTSAVCLCGRTEKPVMEMSKSDIFVLSSYYEGFPNVLCEAMYAGCACISTDCVSGPRELIEQKLNGTLVPIGDVSKMKQALFTYIKNEDIRQKNGKSAQRTVERLYVNNIMKKWCELIEQVGENK